MVKIKPVKIGKRERRNSRPLKPGSSYRVMTTARVADTDGLVDLTMDHTVTVDENFVSQSTSSTWYGLEPDVADAFMEAIEETEVLCDITTTRWKDVCKAWDRITKMLEKLNRMAEKRIKELDKEDEDED